MSKEGRIRKLIVVGSVISGVVAAYLMYRRGTPILTITKKTITNPVGTLLRASESMLAAPSAAMRGLGSVAGGVRDLLGMGRPPRGPFDRQVGSGRRFAMSEAPVYRFKEIKDALGGTVNDIVLTVVAAGLHELLRMGGHEPPADGTLRASPSSPQRGLPPLRRVKVMSSILAANWWAVMIRGLAGILLGILCFAMPGPTLGALVLLFGNLEELRRG